jgi:hypothetical protein
MCSVQTFCEWLSKTTWLRASDESLYGTLMCERPPHFNAQICVVKRRCSLPWKRVNPSRLYRDSDFNRNNHSDTLLLRNPLRTTKGPA